MVSRLRGATRMLAFVVQCARASESGPINVHILEIHEDQDDLDGQAAREVSLQSGTFLVRIAVGHGRVMERCFIRHIASAREAYVQGGPGLSRFVQDCLLDRGGPDAAQLTT